MQPELLTTQEEWQRHASEQPATTVSPSPLLIRKLEFPVPALHLKSLDSRPLMATKSFKDVVMIWCYSVLLLLPYWRCHIGYSVTYRNNITTDTQDLTSSLPNVASAKIEHSLRSRLLPSSWLLVELWLATTACGCFIKFQARIRTRTSTRIVLVIRIRRGI